MPRFSRRTEFDPLPPIFADVHALAAPFSTRALPCTLLPVDSTGPSLQHAMNSLYDITLPSPQTSSHCLLLHVCMHALPQRAQQQIKLSTGHPRLKLHAPLVMCTVEPREGRVPGCERAFASKHNNAC